jgi:hypothetical protein
VYAKITMKNGTWASHSQMLASATSQCLPRALGYFDRSSTYPDLVFGSIFPTQADWQAGHRGAQCFALDIVKNFTGDVKNDR